MAKVVWTDNLIKRLKALIADNMSATQIAIKLDCGATRNAIIGKVRRLGLQLKGNTNSGGRPRKSKFRPSMPTSMIEPRPAPVLGTMPAARGGEMCDLIDLTFTSCRFPFGDGPPYKFCGKQTFVEGASWCADHSRIVYQRRA